MNERIVAFVHAQSSLTMTLPFPVEPVDAWQWPEFCVRVSGTIFIAILPDCLRCATYPSAGKPMQETYLNGGFQEISE